MLARHKGLALKILVTGATGFVGRCLVSRLLIEKFDVIASFRGEAAFPDNVSSFRCGNLDAETDWSEVLRGVDAIVHLAARVHVMSVKEATSSLAEFRRVNVEASNALATQARAAGVRHFMFVSSVKVNGEESHLRPFLESDIPNPLDNYSRSKWEAEQQLRATLLGSDTGLTVLRPPLIYGPGVRANFAALLSLVDRGWPLPVGSIENQRSLLFVENLVDALVHVIKRPPAGCETFFVADTRSVSTPELILLMAQALGKRARIWHCPPVFLNTAGALLGRLETVRRLTSSLAVSTRKLREVTGWVPPFSLEQGISRTAEWYIAQQRHGREVR